jgi:protein-S-isoprenylcysteine O-methyltransferase Ste14
MLLTAAVAAAWLMGRHYPLAWPGFDDLPARVVGWSLGLAGVLLLAWAGRALARHRTTILPHRAASALVTDGPYRHSRNPIYLADVLILLGLAELTKNVWFVLFAATFAALVTWLAILPEERHLEARFGEAWLDYARRTRRWI